LNEIVRRVDPRNRTMGQIIKEDFMDILDVEYYLGLPAKLEHRISPLIGFPALRTLGMVLVPSYFQKSKVTSGIAKILNTNSLSYKATVGTNPKQIRMWPHTHNRKEIWFSEGPSYGGITNAKSLATFAALIANEGSFGLTRLISPQAVKDSLALLPWMPDAVVSRNVTFSVGGWGMDLKFPGSDLEWIGWGGVGGSMVFFNRETKISFSYVMNSMTLSGIGDHRSFSLISELVNCYYKLQQKSEK
jgi:CubicO group peptidase (beta-lactamase class C family)